MSKNTHGNPVRWLTRELPYPVQRLQVELIRGLGGETIGSGGRMGKPSGSLISTVRIAFQATPRG